MPSLPPTAYRYPLSTATPTPSRRVLIDAARAHRFVCGSYLQQTHQINNSLRNSVSEMTFRDCSLYITAFIHALLTRVSRLPNANQCFFVTRHSGTTYPHLFVRKEKHWSASCARYTPSVTPRCHSLYITALNILILCTFVSDYSRVCAEKGR